MAQFQVYRLRGGQLVVDLQTDLVETGYRVVARLRPLGDGPRPFGVLEPIFPINGKLHQMMTPSLAAISALELSGPPVADLSAHDYEIRRAIDMVFSGF